VSNLRILVLTSSTGGGHDARAVAFSKWVKRLYGWSVEVRIESMLEDSSALNRFGVWFYNFIQKHAPWFHHPYYLMVEGLRFLNGRRVFVGNRYYTQVLENYLPHLVFSVHDCLNRGYFQTARRVLGSDRVRCATYCSEFSGGYGYSGNWIEPTVDLYISRTQTARDYAVKLGMDPERIVVRGHMMAPRVYEEVFIMKDRQNFRKENLGLDPNRFTVFLATGGAGANNHLELLPVLAKYADRVQAIVVCGRNHRAFLKVNEWRRSHPELLCHVEGYCQQMHLLVQASDAIVTRGGTTTCAKAMHYRCPIILNGFKGIMPQESLTVKYFTQDDASEVITRAADLDRIIGRWMTDPASYRALKDRFCALRYDEDPTLVIKELVDMAREAATATLVEDSAREV
jgi:processive 1,2-diacylglycerol beta-glucosyltransferase